MQDILFLQSELADPWAFYARMLAQQPLYFDEERRLWGVYSHAACSAVLACSEARIPPLPASAVDGLAGPAAILQRNLVRLGNPPAHAGLRMVAQRLFERLQPAGTAALLAQLLPDEDGEADWVAAVCRKLPALAVMHALDLAPRDIDFLLPRMDRLTAFMLPHRTAAQLDDLNALAEETWPLLRAHAARLGEGGDGSDIAAANLAGLLIQSHDAGRGLLGNVLLQALRHAVFPAPGDWQGLVRETLRFDPPIHNTRRAMTRDLRIGDCVLHAGDTVLVVLAAANRDPAVFAQPDRFDAGRENHAAQLGFGAGAHACIARHFAEQLAVDTLAALSARRVRLLQEELRYEPLVNARLLRKLRIGISLSATR